MPFEAGRYRAGHLGARIYLRDGRRLELPAHASLDLDQEPRKVVGRLFRLRRDGQLGYEAPQFKPSGEPPSS
jgi:hypothetical protein